MLLKSHLSLLSRLLPNLIRSSPVSASFYSTVNIEYEIVEPFPISIPVRTFPGDIGKPDYAKHGYPNKHANASPVKKVEDIHKIWNACKIAKTILMTTGQQVKVWPLWEPLTLCTADDSSLSSQEWHAKTSMTLCMSCVLSTSAILRHFGIATFPSASLQVSTMLPFTEYPTQDRCRMETSSQLTAAFLSHRHLAWMVSATTATAAIPLPLVKLIQLLSILWM